MRSYLIVPIKYINLPTTFIFSMHEGIWGVTIQKLINSKSCTTKVLNSYYDFSFKEGYNKCKKL